MSNKLPQFYDSAQMLSHTDPQQPQIALTLQHIHQKSAGLSPQLESCRIYQKSNNSLPGSDEASELDEGLRVWTLQQQNQLISLHNQKGNKWVQISHVLNKSDNEVKNRYHSKLRKGIRKINKFLGEGGENTSKTIKCNIISKIIQTAEDVYITPPSSNIKQAKEGYQLKNAILTISNLPEEGLSDPEREMIGKTVQRICEFNRTFKKKCKVTPVNPPVSSKYKGKEIMTLLKENEMNSTLNRKKQPSFTHNQSPHQSPPQELPSLSFSHPQPTNHLQTYLLFNQPYFYPSFYLTCLPTSYLESYDRLPPAQLSEMTQERVHSMPSMVFKVEEGLNGENSASFP